MRTSIFRSMLLLSILILASCTAVFLYKNAVFQTKIMEEVRAQRNWILSAAAESGGAEFVEALKENPPQGLRLFYFDAEKRLLAALGPYESAEEIYQKALICMELSGASQLTTEQEDGCILAMGALSLENGGLLYYELEGADTAAETQLGWYLFGLWLFSLLGAYLLSRRLTHVITRPFDAARLEDLAVQEVCAELQPLAARMLDQNLQIQKQLRKQHAELKLEYEKQDRTRRDFTANVSHELKTPLTSISGYAEILRDGLVREEDVTRCSGKIYDEAQRMIVLVGDILKLSQLDEGYQVLMERVRLDLYAICERVIARLQPAADARRISFTLDGESQYIIAVEQIVDEVVYNLCDNAIKYNREGGSVALSLSGAGGKVILEVEDTGIGISPQEQKRVFERFYRVDKSHSKEIGGTGLGLSIVKHGALYHEARIEMESTPGEGTRFRVLFPAAPEGDALDGVRV